MKFPVVFGEVVFMTIPIVPIIQNSVIILALAVLYDIAYRLSQTYHRARYDVWMGVVFGAMVMVMQLTPIIDFGDEHLHVAFVLLIYASLVGGWQGGGIALTVYVLFDMLVQGQIFLASDIVLAVMLTGLGYALRVGYKAELTAYRIKELLAIWLIMTCLCILLPIMFNTDTIIFSAPELFAEWMITAFITFMLTNFVLQRPMHLHAMEQAEKQHREYESFLTKAMSDDIYHAQFDETGKIIGIRALFHQNEYDDANDPLLQADIANMWMKTIHPDDVHLFEKLMAGLSRGEPVSIELRTKLKDDPNYLWRRIYSVPIINRRTRQLERAYFSLKDIQAEKTAAQERQQVALERQRVEILKAFSVQAEHQFRTPLTSIHTNVYLLRKVTDEAKRKKYLDNIETQAHLLLELVESLNLLTQIEIREELTIHNIQLNEVVQGLLPMYINKAQEKDIEIISALAPTLPRLYANHLFIKSSVAHLLRNAVSYTPNGGKIHVQTRLRLGEGGKKHAELVVQDNGVGMSETVKKHAFERFFRADVAQTTAGLGLGLPLVHEVAKHYGGEVLLDSAVGAGTTVTLRLPIEI
jgi:signal transduction histidine kinase